MKLTNKLQQAEGAGSGLLRAVLRPPPGPCGAHDDAAASKKPPPGLRVMLFFPLLTFFSSHLPLVSRSVLSSSWARCSPAKVFFPPLPAPPHQSVLQKEGKSFHPPGKLSPKAGGPRFCAKTSPAGPAPCPPIHKKSYFCAQNDPPNQTSQYESLWSVAIQKSLSLPRGCFSESSTAQ